MKKIFAFTIFMFISLVAANAQKSVKFGLGPAVSLPLGGLGEGTSVGLGAELSVAYPISETFELFGQTGFQQFLGKSVTQNFDRIDGNSFSITEKGPSYSHVPFILGGRLVSGNFLVGAGIGYSSYASSVSGFTFSPQFGIRASKIDVILNYTSTSVGGGEAFSYLGIKTAYNF